MKIRAISNQNPPFKWEFGKGKQSYDVDVQAVMTNLKTRLYFFTNDCFFDTTSGINWFDILGTPNNKAQILLEINNCILNSYGVQSIVRSDVTYDDENRSMNISYEVKVFGEILADSVSVGGLNAIN